MKKCIATVFISGVLFAMFGCSSDKHERPPQAPPPPPTYNMRQYHHNKVKHGEHPYMNDRYNKPGRNNKFMNEPMHVKKYSGPKK